VRRETMTRYELNDGISYHSIEAATADAAEAEARRWIEGGDYMCTENPRTTWVDCRITEVDANDEPVDDGESWTITVQIDPPVPACTDAAGHDWQPGPDGVRGHGGGVIARDYCGWCGTYKAVDTWAQRPDTGEQGLTSIRYEEADTRSLYRVAAARVEADDLGEYADVILDDHGEGCDHYRWVMTADREEIVSWAESHGEAAQ
jgi:hypothetical protein